MHPWALLEFSAGSLGLWELLLKDLCLAYMDLAPSSCAGYCGAQGAEPMQGLFAGALPLPGPPSAGCPGCARGAVAQPIAPSHARRCPPQHPSCGHVQPPILSLPSPSPNPSRGLPNCCLCSARVCFCGLHYNTPRCPRRPSAPTQTPPVPSSSDSHMPPLDPGGAQAWGTPLPRCLQSPRLLASQSREVAVKCGQGDGDPCSGPFSSGRRRVWNEPRVCPASRGSESDPLGVP